MHTDNPNHEPSLLMMNSGNMQPIRPSLGSWLTYGLGTENQNLPGFVVLCPGKPVVGPQLWSNSFLPGIYQGTHINNKTIDPERDHPRHRATATSPATAQREQLDLLQELNRAAPRGRAAATSQLEARIAVAGDGLPHAVRGPRRLRPRPGDRRRRATLYGEGEFADACLIARRLAERGVRITQIYYGNDQPWDDHEDITNHRNHAQQERPADRRPARRT